MSASAYLGGGFVMVLSLAAVVIALGSPIMPHEPMLVVVFFGSIVGLISGIIFVNEIKFGVTGRTIFG